MIKTPINLQDLRRKIYTKAKAETAWRFWGLYVHVCKMETLHEAYLLAKKNNGAPGIDGVRSLPCAPEGGFQAGEQRNGTGAPVQAGLKRGSVLPLPRVVEAPKRRTLPC